MKYKILYFKSISSFFLQKNHRMERGVIMKTMKLFFSYYMKNRPSMFKEGPDTKLSHFTIKIIIVCLLIFLCLLS